MNFSSEPIDSSFVFWYENERINFEEHFVERIAN